MFVYEISSVTPQPGANTAFARVLLCFGAGQLWSQPHLEKLDISLMKPLTDHINQWRLTQTKQVSHSTSSSDGINCSQTQEERNNWWPKSTLAHDKQLFVSLAVIKLCVFVKCLDFATNCNKGFIVSWFLSFQTLTSHQRTLNLKELVCLGTWNHTCL